MKQAIALVFFVAICLGVGFLGSKYTSQSISDWYSRIEKPAWTPPNWLFAPVWTFLYISMAIAAWLVWRKFGAAGASAAISMFVVQLIFNALWSYLFFGLRSPGIAFLDIAILFAAIVITAVLFWRHVPFAGVLMLPYAVWVGYASTLNWAIWRMNP